MCQASSEDGKRGEEEKEDLVSGGQLVHPHSTVSRQPVRSDGFQPESLQVISDQAVTVWGTLWKYLEQGLKVT